MLSTNQIGLSECEIVASYIAVKSKVTVHCVLTFVFSTRYEAVISQSDQPIWFTESCTFTSTEFKETFQAFFNHSFEDFEFLGGWILET